MKKLLLALPLLLGLSLEAQNTNPPPSGLQDFGNTVLGYFTSFNTNLDTTFGTSHFDLWVGAITDSGSDHPLMNNIGFSYDLFKSNNTNSEVHTAFALEAEVRNEGVASSLLSAQGGPSFSVIVHDVKLSLYADGGAWLAQGTDPAKYFGEIGVRVKKAWGRHFYGGVGLAAQFPKTETLYSAFMGATF